jgi:FeS assembly protein IscX
MSDLTPLYWEYSYEIVLALMEAHPEANANIDAVGLDQLYQWIIALPNFADDPALVNERILKDILTEWYEAQDG